MYPAKLFCALAVAGALAMPCAALAATGSSATPSTKDASAASATTATKADADKAGAAADAEDKADEAPAGPSEELLAWAQDMDCAACHTVEADSLEDEACTASLHAALKLACVDCHADDGLIDVHDSLKDTAKAPKKLKATEVPATTCATCHDPEKLVEATADSTALTDDEGTVVNPHELPDIKDHDAISCSSCHKTHSDKTPSKAATATCTSCHHENVYECFTCHS